jgi:tRNA (guanine37-N1)-methyltransferase
VLVDVLTLFPQYLAPLDLSLVGKARTGGLLDVRTTDPRAFTSDVHRTVDDTPYGGGAGMVMKPEPWAAALDAVLSRGGPAPAPRLVVPTPAGRPFSQALARELAGEPWLAFACGRYEGIDGRFVDDARRRMPVDEVSLGDYVLAGGEVAVLVVVEAVARLLPGVLGNRVSHEQDSFSDGLLEAPAYTRPPVWRDLEVPPVLLSGDHARIARWRRDEGLRRTARLRPDLLPALEPLLDERDRAVLADEVGGPAALDPSGTAVAE